MPKRDNSIPLLQFRSYNSQTGNFSIVPFSWEGLDSFFQNERFIQLFTAWNGLICLYPRFPDVDTLSLLWVYNPVTKFSKKLSMPFKVDKDYMYFAEICYTQNTLKLVMAGFSLSEKRRYTLVFDSHSNSWYEGPPLSIDLSYYNSLSQSNLWNQGWNSVDLSIGPHHFFNGVIYFVAKVESIDTQQLKEIRDVEALFRENTNLLYMIIGYDVNQDQWGFSIFVPTSVGYIYCLTEWEGNLLVCASNSSHRHHWDWDFGDWQCDGRFVFWILDTEHKLWIRERELDLSHQFLTFWKVFASGGLRWITCGYNSVIVYDMKNRHWSTHTLDDTFAFWQPKCTSFVAFEPTLLSF